MFLTMQKSLSVLNNVRTEEMMETDGFMIFFTFNLKKVNFHVILIFLLSSWCRIISSAAKRLKQNWEIN